MNIGASVNIVKSKTSVHLPEIKTRSSETEVSYVSKNKDAFEMSSFDYTAYDKYPKTKEPYAVSGSDRLEITRSEGNKNEFVIHFSDSAQLGRTVENGYLFVNGVKIDLSDSMKKLLTKSDKIVQTNKRLAFESSIMEENMEAAKKQSEASEDFFDQMSKVFEIASRISKGGKVPPADEQLLMDVNPGLYMMSRLAAMTAKKHKKYESLIEEEEQQDTKLESQQTIVSYETQMCVSLDGTPSVESVSSAEINE